MKIGVISDTHDNLISLKKAIALFKENKVEMIIHCGDWVSPFVTDYLSKNIDVPIKGILGNNKGDIKRMLQRNSESKNPIEFPKGEMFSLKLDDKKIVVYHGEDPDILNALIACGEYNAIFTGHNHKIRNEMVDSVLVLNPGTTCYACEGEIIDLASIAIYDTSENSAEIIKF